MVSRHQIKKAIQVLEQANIEGFKEISDELQNTLNSLKKNIHEMDEYHKLTSADMGKAQVVFGFDEKFFANLNIEHSFPVQNFINDWMQKQSDWRYPWCLLLPTRPNYTEHCLKSTLVYVCTNNFTLDQTLAHVKRKLNKIPSSSPQMFKVKRLNHEGIIDDYDVPHNQIKFTFSIDYFPYLSIEQVRNYIQHLSKILRPGGEALLHITDADNEDEWKSVVGKQRTYCSTEIIKDFASQFNLNYENVYHVDSMYTFFHLSKPGEISTQKKYLTKIEKY